ncbi:type II secretion system protein [Maricaulis salignorans]|uniref:General secretion pathway protein H n=1 Tax=Maricaulis salignorans TaxID=144026 RepID=A0A1G9M022_9PROT|nr:type II secretion system protein [Maricaulis salignorans]SDL67599.1 general secretion pathway protein H [Maricaulis salignorans]
MVICHAADPRRGSSGSERGMTLLELLIALSIFAAIATLSGVALSGSLAHLRHQRAAELLVSDLRRASLAARSLGRETRISLSPEGYAIEALDIERVWPRDVTARWRIRQAGYWQTATGLALPARTVASPDVEVEIMRGADRIAVRIDPVTGRVHAG